MVSGSQYTVDLGREGVNSHSKGSLPPHIERVRAILLCFDSTIPDTYEKFFRQESKKFRDSAPTLEPSMCINPPESSYYAAPGGIPDPTTVNLVDKYKALARTAWYLGSEKSPQEKWEDFLRCHIFRSFEETSPMASRASCAFDKFFLQQKLRFDNENLFSPRSFSLLPKMPEPSFTYGIPITTSRAHDRKPQSLFDLEPDASFSVEVLRRLHPHGLQVSPRAGLFRWVENGSGDMDSSDMVCFPWSIVEVHPVPSTCLLQAVNSASAALGILHDLYQKCGNIKNEAPPVVFFTCSGPVIEVWIAYFELQDEKYEMKRVCIWRTNLTLTWGLIAIQHIVANMTFWGMRVLKPQLSACIGQLSLTTEKQAAKTVEIAVQEKANLEPPPPASTKPLPPEAPRFLPSPLRQPETGLIYIPIRFQTCQNICTKVRLPNSTPMPLKKVDQSTSDGAPPTRTAVAENKSGSMTTKDISSAGEARPNELKTNLHLPIRPKYTCSNSGGVASPQNSWTTLTSGQKFTISVSMPVFYQYKLKGSSTSWLDAEWSGSASEDEAGSDALSECSDENIDHDKGNKADGQSDASDEDSASMTCDDGESEENQPLGCKISQTSERPIILGPLGSTAGPRLLGEIEKTRLISRALKSLPREAFIQLDATQKIISKLCGVELLDVVWKALEPWQFSKMGDVSQFGSLLFKLNNVMGFDLPDEAITMQQLSQNKRWDHVDTALHFVWEEGDESLRSLLVTALMCWDTDMIIGILQEEFDKLPEEERSYMGKQALSILYESPELKAIPQKRRSAYQGSRESEYKSDLEGHETWG